MGRHPPCDAPPMESSDSALLEGIGSSVAQLYHRSRKELTNVHAEWVVVLILWFLR